MRRRKILLICSLTAIPVIVALLWWMASKKSVQTYHRMSTTEIRKAVKNISISQVAYIEIDALPGPPGIVTVRDPKTIDLLLKGLKNAKVPATGFHGRDDWVLIYLKNGKLAGQFVFNADEKELCFSEEFIKGLKKAGVPVDKKSRIPSS